MVKKIDAIVGGTLYQNIFLARQESNSKNNTCIRGHPNVDVFEKAKIFVDK